MSAEHHEIRTPPDVGLEVPTGGQVTRPTRSLAERLRRRSIGAEVADYIRSKIFDGTLKGDQRVPQDAIAAELGVSRLPVREALITLEADGLVAAVPRRGMFVVPIRQEDIEDHYRIYGMIQGLSASRAVSRITEPVLARLQELLDAMNSNEDPDLLDDLNFEFHSLITRTGSSRRLRSILRNLGHNLSREVYKLPPAGSPQANAGHANILKALRDGDVAAADAACREHLRQEGDYVVSVLKREGILAD